MLTPAIRRGLLLAVCLAAAIASLTAVFVGYTQWGSNFHAVEPGQLYRAGRLPASQLESVVRHYGIKTVINLEGAKPKRSWYRDETAILNRLGVEHIDFRLSAREVAPPERIEALLDTMRSSPKPILVHCRDGADRSGLAAALYLAKILGRDENEAYGQLSLSFGHFPYLGSDTEEMDDTYWLAVDPVHHPD